MISAPYPFAEQGGAGRPLSVSGRAGCTASGDGHSGAGGDHGNADKKPKTRAAANGTKTDAKRKHPEKNTEKTAKQADLP